MFRSARRRERTGRCAHVVGSDPPARRTPTRPRAELRVEPLRGWTCAEQSVISVSSSVSCASAAARGRSAALQERAGRLLCARRVRGPAAGAGRSVEGSVRRVHVVLDAAGQNK